MVYHGITWYNHQHMGLFVALPPFSWNFPQSKPMIYCQIRGHEDPFTSYHWIGLWEHLLEHFHISW